jgi:hypothetical protein
VADLIVQLWENVDSAAMGITTADDLRHVSLWLSQQAGCEIAKNLRVSGDGTFARVRRRGGGVLE